MRTLQLELEYVYGCLEDEALDIGQGTQNPSFLLSRQVPAHLPRLGPYLHMRFPVKRRGQPVKTVYIN